MYVALILINKRVKTRGNICVFHVVYSLASVFYHASVDGVITRVLTPIDVPILIELVWNSRGCLPSMEASEPRASSVASYENMQP